MYIDQLKEGQTYLFTQTNGISKKVRVLKKYSDSIVKIIVEDSESASNGMEMDFNRAECESYLSEINPGIHSLNERVNSRDIKNVTEFIRKTKGAQEALSFFTKYVQPYLISIDSSDHEEMERLKQEIKCINPHCKNDHCDLSFHHFFPKVYRHSYSKRKEIKDRKEGVLVCHLCHRKLHNHKTNKELFENYTTKESLIDLFTELNKLPQLTQDKPSNENKEEKKTIVMGKRF